MKNNKIPKCQLWDSKVSSWHFGNLNMKYVGVKKREAKE